MCRRLCEAHAVVRHILRLPQNRRSSEYLSWILDVERLRGPKAALRLEEDIWRVTRGKVGRAPP